MTDPAQERLDAAKNDLRELTQAIVHHIEALEDEGLTSIPEPCEKLLVRAALIRERYGFR